ncbi:MAG: carbonic anhydrase [Planctomycetaceae bacterium]
MKKLVEGWRKYHNTVFPLQAELFQELSQGQHPGTLFITCSDSRIDPCLITQTQPGDLFVLRNAGNIVPPYGASNGGESAAVEFAVAALGVKDIVVCGHSLCGAIKGLLNPDALKTLPAVTDWLNHAENTRQLLAKKHADKTGNELLNVAIQEHALMQLSNLKTHPTVAAGLETGTLNLHAWVYAFEAGDILAYDSGQDRFASLSENAE